MLYAGYCINHNVFRVPYILRKKGILIKSLYSPSVCFSRPFISETHGDKEQNRRDSTKEAATGVCAKGKRGFSKEHDD